MLRVQACWTCCGSLKPMVVKIMSKSAHADKKSSKSSDKTTSDNCFMAAKGKRERERGRDGAHLGFCCFAFYAELSLPTASHGQTHLISYSSDQNLHRELNFCCYLVATESAIEFAAAAACWIPSMDPFHPAFDRTVRTAPLAALPAAASGESFVVESFVAAASGSTACASA